jgi:hypothetical protein
MVEGLSISQSGETVPDLDQEFILERGSNFIRADARDTEKSFISYAMTFWVDHACKSARISKAAPQVVAVLETIKSRFQPKTAGQHTVDLVLSYSPPPKSSLLSSADAVVQPAMDD